MTLRHLQCLVELEVSKNSFHLKIISHVLTEASLKNTNKCRSTITFKVNKDGKLNDDI